MRKHAKFLQVSDCRQVEFDRVGPIIANFHKRVGPRIVKWSWNYDSVVRPLRGKLLARKTRADAKDMKTCRNYGILMSFGALIPPLTGLKNGLGREPRAALADSLCLGLRCFSLTGFWDGIGRGAGELTADSADSADFLSV